MINLYSLIFEKIVEIGAILSVWNTKSLKIRRFCVGIFLEPIACTCKLCPARTTGAGRTWLVNSKKIEDVFREKVCFKSILDENLAKKLILNAILMSLMSKSVQYLWFFSATKFLRKRWTTTPTYLNFKFNEIFEFPERKF